MTDKFPDYIEGDPFSCTERVCNVIVCKDCGEEWLLGQRNKDGTRPDNGHNITLRQNPTLISRR